MNEVFLLLKKLFNRITLYAPLLHSVPRESEDEPMEHCVQLLVAARSKGRARIETRRTLNRRSGVLDGDL